jgi:plastocyanin
MPRRFSPLLVLAVASVVLAACGGSNKVGSEKILDFKEEAQGRLGTTTTTAAPQETAPPAGGGKAGVGGATTTAVPATTIPKPTTTTTERKQTTFEIAIRGDNTGATQFDPSASRVFAGTLVKFVNKDTEPRSVESDTNAFQSPSIPPGGSWTYDAKTAGKFNFHDGTRPYATGSLEVLAR